MRVLLSKGWLGLREGGRSMLPDQQAVNVSAERNCHEVLELFYAYAIEPNCQPELLA
jgi:hypothetical protein